MSGYNFNRDGSTILRKNGKEYVLIVSQAEGGYKGRIVDENGSEVYETSMTYSDASDCWAMLIGYLS